MKNKWKLIYYSTNEGKVPVKEFINSRSIDNQVKIAALIDYLEQKGVQLPRPYADYIGDGLYELRVKLSGDQSRTFYFFATKII